jgi:hypothetical protein
MQDTEMVVKAKEKLKNSISIYLGNTFSDLEEVLYFHINALKHEDLYEVPKVDYMKLQRFIVTAVNNLKDKDPAIQTTLFVKLYKDINVLIKFYNHYVKAFNHNAEKHADKFMNKSKAYASIIEEATGNKYSQEVQDALKNSSSIEVVGAASRDEFNIYAKNLFMTMYDERFTKNVSDMKDVVNIKSEMFDKVFWSNARKSGTIKNYFNDIGVQNHFNLKTYIESYLKSIDVSKMKDASWHEYLQKCIKYLS